MKMSFGKPALIAVLLAASSVVALAGNAPNSQPNPYRTIRDFFKLPRWSRDGFEQLRGGGSQRQYLGGRPLRRQ